MAEPRTVLRLSDDLVLRGKDVVLRPLVAADAESLAQAAAESRDSYGFTPVPDGIDAARAYIDKALRMKEAGQRFAFAVEWRGRVAGSTSYAQFQPWDWGRHQNMQRRDRPDAVEIGYTWLAASAQGTGCNAEAKYLLLRQAFEAWRVHRVFLKTDARNLRSRAAIERLGARLDGVLRSDMPAVDGTPRDSAWYSLLPSEWPEVKAGLEKRLLGR